MHQVLIIAVIVISLVYRNSGAKLPSTFKKCKRDDSVCLTSAIMDCLPKLDHDYKEIALPNLNPLEIPAMVIGSGTGPVSVVQDYKNVKIFGVHEGKVMGARLDWDKNVFQINLTLPLRFESDYVLDGKVLLLPIKGKGKSTLILEDVHIYFESPFQIQTKTGKEYLKFSNFKAIVNPAKVNFHFGNLFNGDKQLSDSIHKVLNDNWHDIYQDVRSGYEDVLSKLIESTCNAVFSRVSLQEAFEK